MCLIIGKVKSNSILKLKKKMDNKIVLTSISVLTYAMLVLTEPLYKENMFKESLTLITDI